MSNQTEEIMELGTVYSFPDWKTGPSYQRPLPGMAIGDACPVTMRAALLSRSPGRVHEMFMALTDNCFEVMMFRKWEPRLQSALDTGLIIADMTGCRDMHAFNKEKELLLPERSSIPVLFLVGEELMSNAGAHLVNEELMVWPARSKDTLMYQVQRTIRLFSPVPAQDLGQDETNGIVYKDLAIDRDKMTVHRGHVPIHLTKTEYQLLLLLLDGKGAVCTREELMSKIWDTDFMGGSNVVDVHIKSLRKKLSDNAGAPRYIATVRGVGYRLAD